MTICVKTCVRVLSFFFLPFRSCPSSLNLGRAKKSTTCSKSIQTATRGVACISRTPPLRRGDCVGVSLLGGMTSSVRSSVATGDLDTTPRHLLPEDLARDEHHYDGQFVNEDDVNGIPPQSPASPTRRSDRASAAAAALNRLDLKETGVDQGVYVSEPHFAPPRMDESHSAFAPGDERKHKEWDTSLFTKSLAVGSSPSSHKPSTSSSGFVPSPAERRAAALALERSQAVQEPIQEETAVEETINSSVVSVRSVGASHDEEVLLVDDTDDENHDYEKQSEHHSTHDSHDSTQIDADIMAALMAEAMSDAARSRDGAEELFASVSSSAQGMEFVRRGAAAVVRAQEAARASTDLSASTSLRNSVSNSKESWSMNSSVQSSPRRRSSRSVSVRSSTATLPATSPTRSPVRRKDRKDQRTAHLTLSAEEAADLRVSVESLRASLEKGTFFHETDADESAVECASPIKTNESSFLRESRSPQRSSLRSPPRLSRDSETRSETRSETLGSTHISTLSSPPNRSPTRHRSSVMFQDTLEPLRALETNTRDTDKVFVAKNPVSSPSSAHMTPRAVSARNAMEQRRRAAENECKEAAAALQQRRKEAGAEALARFFSAKKDKQNEVDSKTLRNPSNPRTPLRLKGGPGTVVQTAAEGVGHNIVTHQKPSPKPSPLPKVAMLQPGQRQHAGLSAAAAAAQAAKDAVFEASRVATATARDRSRRRGEDTAEPHQSPLPRVAVLGDYEAASHARDTLHVEAAAQHAAASIKKATRSAAAYSSAKETIVSQDEMPSRCSPAPPLPKVGLFDIDQRSHVTRAEQEAISAARELTEAEALEAIKLRAAAARAEAKAAKAALDAEKAEAAAAELFEKNKLKNRTSVEDAFPSWFGVVGDEHTDSIRTRNVVSGFVTGAAQLTETSNEGHLDETNYDENNSETDYFASPAPLFVSQKAKPPTRPPLAKPNPKPEAMWIDVGGWRDASKLGVPSGAWGDTGKNNPKHPPVLGTHAVEQRSLASVAAGRRNKATTSNVKRVGVTPQGRDQHPSSVVPMYKRSAKLSNKKLVKNALAHVCLAGAAMKGMRDTVLGKLEDVPASVATVFVILFRENTSPHRFKALYALVRDEENEKVEKLQKIHGTGPSFATLSSVDCTMKYDRGTREFKPLATSAVGPQTAAVTLVKR